MTDTPTDRLVVALDPSPATRALVTRRIVEFAAELGDVDLLDQVVDAAEVPEGIGSVELAERAGVTYRQVNYWTTEGYLLPLPGRPGSGNPKRYGADQIVKARVMGALVRLLAMHPENASDVADRIIAEGTTRVGPFTIGRRGRAS